MIQIYRPGDSLTTNGISVLTPSECTVSAKINEVWVLNMTHPLDAEGRWKYIVDEGILKVPTWQRNQSGTQVEQYYRISQIEKTDTDVKVVAYPIFMDARNQVFIEDLTVTGTPKTMMTQMLALGPTQNGSPIYSCASNIATAKKATFTLRNFIDCLNGADEPTIVGMFGGEVHFNNFTITVNDQIGSDNNVYVRYGKNITGIEYSIDWSDVCTRIYPQAYGGYEIQSGQKWVDSSLINQYDVLYVRNMVFDDIRLLDDVSEDEKESGNYIVCSDRAAMDTYLRQACREAFADGCDKPKVSMKVDLVELSATDQYKEYASMEKISLGDTVHCVHEKLGITSDARAIGIVWDCALNRIQSVELGDFTYDYFADTVSKVNAISGILNPDGSIMAERVAGVLNGIRTAIHTIRSVATQADSMAILFEDTVRDSPTYGALGIGTKGLMIADTWDDSTNDWAWETAITSKGILTPMLITSVISDQSALNWWDLQMGQISFQTISDDINDRIDTAIENLDLSDMTGQEICQAIFADGSIKGFKTYTVNNKTYFAISFSDAIGGTLKLGGSSNGNGVLTLCNSDGDEIMEADSDGIKIYALNSTTPGKIIGYDASGYKRSALHMCDTTSLEGWSANNIDGLSQGTTFDGTGINGYSSRGIALSAPKVALCYYAYSDKVSYDGGGPDIIAFTKQDGFSLADSKRFFYPSPISYDGTVSQALCWRSNGEVGVYSTTSSKRYKQVFNTVKADDISEAYNVKVYMARYKEGHLDPSDPRCGVIYPMFIVEQMDKHLPIAVDYKDGKPETWNERAIIPIMFQMIKDQAARIDEQNARLEEQNARISKLESMIESLTELIKSKEED